VKSLTQDVREIHNPLRQDDDYIKIHSSVVGANFWAIMSDDKQGMSIKVLRLMFCGGLFVQAIGVGSNHVVEGVLVTLAKAKP
jgi:hypothetical protein